MSILTAKQKEKYLKKGGNICPFCESESICGEGVDIDGTFATQEVSCSECGESWEDVYKLFGIEN